ncbi:MAG: hypothetical protein AAGI53_13760 [Planctomycetota bacterium]
MMDLRLTTDERGIAPDPIPFPGRRERAGSRTSDRAFAPGRMGGLGSGRRTTTEVDAALERVQDNLNTLFGVVDELEAADEVKMDNPLPMKHWRWEPDNDGPSAA